ncbi:AMP-binding protein [Streptomyces sp. NPDC015130]|uniref:AMP-binding protein n=1 Tax=Streptomyces sp. NPDC015130 TaxID=3364940 RepID=UPI003700FCE0
MRSPCATRAFRTVRDVLLEHRDDLDAAREKFAWPQVPRFNWALDWFDVIARDNDRTALHLIGTVTDDAISYRRLAQRSDQVANWLTEHGVARGDRVLIALHNLLPLWEVMIAAIKISAIIVPTYPTASPAELKDRIERAGVSHVVTSAELAPRFAGIADHLTGICTDGPVPDGWLDYSTSYEAPREPYEPVHHTGADDPLFCYFTSGTTSRPKMVIHTHTSYPVGHLSGMYWNGVQPGDRHLNIAAPGWAKHAWSSFFVPFNAEATAVAFSQPRTEPHGILRALRRHDITSFCAPPTVWRAMFAHGLGDPPGRLTSATSAGEPLDTYLVDAVRDSWGITLRNGYGQTETTCQIGVPPGREGKPGSMGWPMPGYRTAVLNTATGNPVREDEPGELCLDLSDMSAGVMAGYHDDGKRTARAFAGGIYRTGDIVTRGEDGALYYSGRDDDMFKSFDHRISPLELETAALTHPAVAAAAVVPEPDPIGMFIPKAHIVLAPGWDATEVTARRILTHVSEKLPDEKMIKAVEFTEELPLTASGKIQRSVLRNGHHESTRETWTVE